MEPFSDDEVVFSEEPTHEFRSENREDGVLNQTDWIVLSSSFFSFPAIRELVIVTTTPAKYNPANQYLSILIALISIVSVNYWRKPEKGWRLTIDLIFARVSFVIFTVMGLMYIDSNKYKVPTLVSIVLSPSLYLLSTKYDSMQNPVWIKFHMAFHLVTAIAGGSVIESIRNHHMGLSSDLLENIYCDAVTDLKTLY